MRVVPRRINPLSPRPWRTRLVTGLAAIEMPARRHLSMTRRLHRVGGARVAQEAFLGKGDGLALGDVAAVGRRGQDPLERPEPADRVHVDMRTKPCGA